MVLAINIMPGRGPSNKTRLQLQLKKTKVKAVLAVYVVAKSAVHY